MHDIHDYVCTCCMAFSRSEKIQALKEVLTVYHAAPAPPDAVAPEAAEAGSDLGGDGPDGSENDDNHDDDDDEVAVEAAGDQANESGAATDHVESEGADGDVSPAASEPAEGEVAPQETVGPEAAEGEVAPTGPISSTAVSQLRRGKSSENLQKYPPVPVFEAGQI